MSPPPLWPQGLAPAASGERAANGAPAAEASLSSPPPAADDERATGELHRLALTSSDDDALCARLDGLPQKQAERLINWAYGSGRRNLLHTLAARRPPLVRALERAIELGGDVAARAADSAQPLHLALGWSRTLLQHAVVPALAAVAGWEEVAQTTNSLPLSASGLSAHGLNPLVILELAESKAEVRAAAGQEVLEALTGCAAAARRQAVCVLLDAGANPQESVLLRPSRVGAEATGLIGLFDGPGWSANALTLAIIGGDHICVEKITSVVQKGRHAFETLDRGLQLTLTLANGPRLPEGARQAQEKIALKMTARAWELAKSGPQAQQQATALLSTLVDFGGRVALGRMLNAVHGGGPQLAGYWCNQAHGRGLSPLARVLRGRCEAPLVARLLELGADPNQLSRDSVGREAPPLFWAVHVFQASMVSLLLCFCNSSMHLVHPASPAQRRYLETCRSEALMTKRRGHHDCIDMEVVRTLVAHGADPTATLQYRLGDYFSQIHPSASMSTADRRFTLPISLLDVAVACDHVELARFLLDLEKIRHADAILAGAPSTFPMSGAMRSLFSDTSRRSV